MVFILDIYDAVTFCVSFFLVELIRLKTSSCVYTKVCLNEIKLGDLLGEVI